MGPKWGRRWAEMPGSDEYLLALLDLRLAFTWVNDAFSRAAGQSLGNLVGRGFFDFYPNPANEAIFRRVLETGRGFAARSGQGRALRLSERSECRWDCELSRAHGADGEPTGLLVVLRNVSSRVSLEREPLLGNLTARAIAAPMSCSEACHSRGSFEGEALTLTNP